MTRGSYGTGQAGNLDFAGFAQEFLRRNPAYIRDYRVAMPGTGPARTRTEQEEMARRWGLTFSLRS